MAAEPVMSVTSTDLLLALIVAAGPGALGHLVMAWAYSGCRRRRRRPEP